MRGRLQLLLLLSGSLAGCFRDDGAADAPAPGPGSAAPAATTEAPSPTATAAVDDGAPLPRPLRARLGAALALNATCVSCHDEEATAWATSRHRQASTNSAFRAAFALEPAPFCRGCHAPEADPGKPPTRAVSELGVGCVTCHVTEDGVVLAAARDDAPEAAPHPLRRSAAFGGAGACAGCHEFRFPGMPGEDDDAFMQTTAREHARSPAAARACAACHMPLVEGRRSHAFAATRDAGWLRRTLRATAARAGAGVRVTLVQTDPGHAFPTGDLFRRLEVGCEVRGADGRLLQREVRHLARHFQLLPGRSGRVLVGDDRVFAEPSEVDVTLAPAPSPGARAHWWVSYQRVATVGTGTDPADAKIESEVQLHSGEMPWEND